MATFRSAEKQAKHQVNQRRRFGDRKHGSDKVGIFSKGTSRNYQQALTQVATWMKNNKHAYSLTELTTAHAKLYLKERQGQVSQSTLNQERQALQMLLGCRLPVYRGTNNKSALVNQSRVYTDKQYEAVLACLTPQQAFATALTREAGLRAHELLTIRPLKEQSPSPHRNWHADQFRGNQGVSYTVVGKGGLVREVRLSPASAKELERYRQPEPISVIDRGIKYRAYYKLPAGQALSQAFTQASKAALGWSKGLHSTRHMYAQQRMLDLMKSGIKYHDALAIVSQNLAHFRAEITETYLR